MSKISFSQHLDLVENKIIFQSPKSLPESEHPGTQFSHRV